MKKGFLIVLTLILAVLCGAFALSACNHQHTLTYLEASEGSCTEQGNIECWYCSGCDKYFADEDAVTELREVDVFTGKHHNWGVWQVLIYATCSTSGLQMRECSDCGALEEQLIAAQHVWGDWGYDKEPTCRENGYMSRTCLRCREKETNIILAGEAYHKYNSYYCIYCGKLYNNASGVIDAPNAPIATTLNWLEYDSKSATTTVNINNAEIALGVNGNNKAVSITASAQIDFARTWENGVLTIDIAAKLTAIGLYIDINGDGRDDLSSDIKNLLVNTVNLDALTGLEFKAQAFYNYGSEEKTIGVRNMTVSGLASAIPAVVSGNPTANITDQPYAIKFMNSSSGQYESEVSFDLASIDLSGAQAILDSVFGQGYNLDLVGIIEGLLVNQTMLDFSDATNAAYADGQYQNNVKVTDNLNFITEIWNQISSDGKEMVGTMLGDAVIPVDEGDKNDPNDDIKIKVGDLLKNILGVTSLNNLLPDLLAKVEGTMSVSGTVEDGIFSSLNATLSGTGITLTQANVEYIVENVAVPIIASIDNIDSDMQGIIDQVLPIITDGSAYISLGTIIVNSTFSTI